MTGDIINLGLGSEYALGRAWLADVGVPQDVSFVPGNHDAYARGTFGEIARAFGPWMQGGGLGGARDGEMFPYVRRIEKIALIGVSSALPTAPFLASGALGPGQRARLAAALRAARTEGLARVVLIHHPPHRAGAPPSRGLRDASGLEAVIAAEGAELILHGHNHRMALAHLPGPSGAVPVAGVASASLRPGGHGEGAGYRLFRIEGNAGEWRIGMRTRVMRADGVMADAGEGWRQIAAEL